MDVSGAHQPQYAGRREQLLATRRPEQVECADEQVCIYPQKLRHEAVLIVVGGLRRRPRLRW